MREYYEIVEDINDILLEMETEENTIKLLYLMRELDQLYMELGKLELVNN